MHTNNQDLNHGLWQVTTKERVQLAPLCEYTKSDVIVIGGGYTGLSAALHMSQNGMNVRLLEAVEIGFGGSGRNVGLVNAGLWLKPDDIVAILGTEYAEQLIVDLGHCPTLVFELIKKYDISCEAQRRGTLHCAHSPNGMKELIERKEQWQKRGTTVSLLDAKQASDRIGSDAFYGALLDERAGTIQPLAFAHGLARAAIEEGAILHSSSPVKSLEYDGSLWRAITPNGAVAAPRVVLACNEYATKGLSQLRQAQIPFHYFQFATSPLSLSARQRVLRHGEGAWDTHKILSSFRLDKAGRLIVGSVGSLHDFARPLHKSGLIT